MTRERREPSSFVGPVARLVRPGARLALMALAIAACAPLEAQREPPPWVPRTAALPPVPFHDGPLALTLVYPSEGSEVTVRDRTFVFGATGTGRARVAINGVPVDVAPNGAFLAFLPVPADGVYRAEARAGEERAQVIRRVRVPETPTAPTHGEAFIAEKSVFPRGGWVAMPGEPIEVGFRGTADGEAALVFGDGSRIPLVEQSRVVEVPWGRRVFGAVPPAPEPSVPGLAEYRGVVVARPLLASEPDVPRPKLAPLLASTPSGAAIELRVGRHVTRVPLPLNVALLDPEQPAVGIAFEPDPHRRSAGGVEAAAGPAFTYHYFWDNGTRLTLTGERAGEYRVRLTPDLHAWVASDRVHLLAAGTPPARGRVGTVRLTPGPEAVEVRIEVDRQLPYRVDSRGRSLTITIYGGIADTRWLMSGGLDRHPAPSRDLATAGAVPSPVVGANRRLSADRIGERAVAVACAQPGGVVRWSAGAGLRQLDVERSWRQPRARRRDDRRGRGAGVRDEVRVGLGEVGLAASSVGAVLLNLAQEARRVRPPGAAAASRGRACCRS